MTVYGTALLLPVCGLLVAFGALPSPSRLVSPVGRTTSDPTNTDRAPGPPAMPPASTGLGGAAGTADRPGPYPAQPRGVRSGSGVAGGQPLFRTDRPIAEGMPPGGTPVPAGTGTVTYETETQQIPYRTRVVRDRSMPRGSRTERIAGVPGARTVRYEVTTVDGKQAGRRLVGSIITRQPVTRVIAVGARRGNGRPDRPCRHGRNEHASHDGERPSGERGGGERDRACG